MKLCVSEFFRIAQYRLTKLCHVSRIFDRLRSFKCMFGNNAAALRYAAVVQWDVVSRGKVTLPSFS